MRRQILGVAVLTAVLAVTLFGSVLALAVHRLYYADERGELERLALLGALAVPATVGENADPVELPPTEDPARLAVYSTAGRRLTGTGPAKADDATLQALTGRVSEADTSRELVVAVPVISDEHVIAVSRASTPLSVVRQRLYRAWGAMLVLALLAGGFASILASVQARRLARPLRGLAEAAQELGGGNFAVRARESGVGDIDRAGQALNRTAERLADLIARERAFAVHASHQLRTPLTGLRLGLDSALQTPGADLRQAAAEAIDRSDELSRTIDDVLETARGGAGAVGRVDLSPVLSELQARWRVLLSAQQRELIVDVQTTPVALAAAPAVRQILDVLIDNAYRHGRGSVTVVARDSTDDALAIDVADDGKTAHRLLPPDESSAHQAPGVRRIGLAMALALAEAQGGRLTHVHTESRTRFTLLLPRPGSAS